MLIDLILVHSLGIFIVMDGPSIDYSVCLRIHLVEIPGSFVSSPLEGPVLEVVVQALVSEVEVFVSPSTCVQVSEELDVGNFD